MDLRRSIRVLLWLLLLAATASAAPKQGGLRLAPRVDERVELLSVVFRLAGNFEYNMSPLRHYTADIDSYFAPYKNHPAVEMAKKLAAERGVGFDAVMFMAVYLSPPPALKPLVPFTDQVPEPRWGRENALQFARLLRAFYHDSHFARFYAAHQSMYRLAESRFSVVLSNLDLTWYKAFYGELPPGHFNLMLGMNNGGGSYGPHVVLPGGRQELYAIVGCWTKDEAGDPAYSGGGSDYLSVVIHEFNHSFINPLVAQHWAEFAAASTVYQSVAKPMEALAYGDPKTMVDESLVRAAEILYFEAKDPKGGWVLGRIRSEQTNGFVWMDELGELLRRYQGERDRYPTFRSFLPEVAAFYRDLAPHINDKVAEFHQRCVHVAGLEPFANGALDVDPATQELTITFDKPLDPAKGYSINFGPGGKEHYPGTGKPEFLSGGRGLKLKLALKPGWDYALTLTSLSFATPDGYPLEPYTITFKTR